MLHSNVLDMDANCQHCTSIKFALEQIPLLQSWKRHGC